MTRTGTGDMTIESHDDDSVTLTVGTVKAIISGETWKEANEAAYALGNLLTGRMRVAALLGRTSTLAGIMGDLERLAHAAEHHLNGLVDLVAVPRSGEEAKR